MEASTKPTPEKDRFEQGLMQRLPEDIRGTFSSEQLAALKVAFGARQWGHHPIDLRGTIKIWTWRYYFVFLMGRNRRSLNHREVQLSYIIQAFALTLFLLLSTCVGIVVLYLIKSAAGIDLIPGFSFGLWDWFKEKIL